MRFTLLLALARLRNPAGADLLRHLIEDPDTSVAATAAFGLGQLGDSAHARALVGALADPDTRPTVAAEAAYALGKVGGADARSALITLLAGTPVAPGAAHPVVNSALLAIWKLAPLDDLEPVGRWLQAADPELPVIVKADATNQYQKVVDVLDLIERLEITQLGLVTQRVVK